LAEAIARLARVLPIKQVAQLYRVGWDTVKQIDHRALAQEIGPVDLRDIRIVAMDEFALHRGQRYATVVADPFTKRVLWVGRGRSSEDVSPFFELLGPEGCSRLEAVVADMSPAFTKAIKVYCPQAAIVYDLFHVIAQYGRAVIDRVRVNEMNQVGRALPRGDPRRLQRTAERRVFWSARWLLLRNSDNLERPGDRVRLRELLRANKALFIVYVLKDDLKQLWRFRYPAAARRFWRAWYRRALASRLQPLIRFARHLESQIEGIINHCNYPLNNGFLEGVMNKIKVLKRIAYGYRDDDYFFLKIRAAFPGIPG
jgi:transposase